jgi:hypothetical protein
VLEQAIRNAERFERFGSGRKANHP